MKISARSRYGLKAVLVLAGRFGEGSLSVSQIAKRENISVPYLEQILNSLKKKKLVKSVRGPQGGYMLAKKPSEIDLKELLDALDPGLLTAESPKAEPDGSSDEVKIADRLFWSRLLAAIDESLSEINLKTLIDDARRLKKNKSSSPHTFHI